MRVAPSPRLSTPRAQEVRATSVLVFLSEPGGDGLLWPSRETQLQRVRLQLPLGAFEEEFCWLDWTSTLTGPKASSESMA